MNVRRILYYVQTVAPAKTLMEDTDVTVKRASEVSILSDGYSKCLIQDTCHWIRERLCMCLPWL